MDTLERTFNTFLPATRKTTKTLARKIVLVWADGNNGAKRELRDSPVPGHTRREGELLWGKEEGLPYGERKSQAILNTTCQDGCVWTLMSK